MHCHHPIRILLAALALGAAATLHAQARDSTPDGANSITFTPGLRVQVRYAHDAIDGNNDFFIARTRLKVAGEAFRIAKYAAEIKLDNVGRFAREVNAQVENAWLDLPVIPDLFLRVGLYDAVFSRNALTSDSKLLLMDRSLVKDELTALGLADNTVGALVHGRPFRGRAEYSAGIFDNLQFEQADAPTARQADGAMVMGRIVVHLLDRASPAGGYADYQSSYIGQGRRLSIGANAAYLSKARQGATELDIDGWGGDLLFNAGAFTLEAEYDRFEQAVSGGNPDVRGAGWYVQAAYLVRGALELAARYQELDPNRSVSGNRLRWTSVGLNRYVRDHKLKIQTDYTFKREEGNAVTNDVFQMQLQLDF